jgi:hypothetical protein
MHHHHQASVHVVNAEFLFKKGGQTVQLKLKSSQERTISGNAEIIIQDIYSLRHPGFGTNDPRGVVSLLK